MMLYKSLVRCHLDLAYANSVWSRYQIQFIKALKKFIWELQN